MTDRPRIAVVSIKCLMRLLLEKWDRAYFEEAVNGAPVRTRLEAADSAFEELRGAAERGRLRAWFNGLALDGKFWKKAQFDIISFDDVRLNGINMSAVVFAAVDVKDVFFPKPRMPKIIQPDIWRRVLHFFYPPPPAKDVEWPSVWGQSKTTTPGKLFGDRRNA